MENLITYCSDYDRKEIALSAKAKKGIFETVKYLEQDNGSCVEIYIADKYPEPFNTLTQKDFVTTWRCFLSFENGVVREIRINRKAIY